VLEIQSGRAALYGAAVVLCTAGFVGSTNAGVIFDFEGFANGQELGMGANAIQPYANFFTMSAFANGSPSLGAAIFDSSPLGPNVDTADQDLLVGLGNILILQNGNFPTQTVPGIFDTPNDEADGGTIVFDFVRPMMLLSIDLVDIDHNGPAELFLLDGSGRTRTYDVPMSWTRDVFAQGPNGFDTLDLTTLTPQVGEGGAVATAVEDLHQRVAGERVQRHQERIPQRAEGRDVAQIELGRFVDRHLGSQSGRRDIDAQGGLVASHDLSSQKPA